MNGGIGHAPREESWPQFIYQLLIITYVYLQLLIFQRHRARVRIFADAADERSPMFVAAADKRVYA